MMNCCMILRRIIEIRFGLMRREEGKNLSLIFRIFRKNNFYYIYILNVCVYVYIDINREVLEKIVE